MLIGPTGVGKTTTCAKIVANNWRNEKKVGFITADTYRLEAVSQLKAYANIMRVAIEVVNKPEDLTKTIEKFKDKNVIFLQLEGTDNWLITKEDTPTLYNMMNNSINFTNHYSYYNGGGSTFNSEFAVNTGFITPLSYTQNAYTFNKNTFPYS